ncbi:MAG: hypothetical protein ACM3L8_05575 [Verrucomicrobiota bacterium]
MEHPAAAKSAGPEIGKADLAAAITAYIHGEETKGGGAWKVQDPVDKTILHLTLIRVHDDKLARTAPETYFACADLKDVSGVPYDLDVFMHGKNKDHLKVTEVTIHKKDGKERYTWAESNGIWKKEPVK